jgi:hypothetical protein
LGFFFSSAAFQIAAKPARQPEMEEQVVPVMAAHD